MKCSWIVVSSFKMQKPFLAHGLYKKRDFTCSYGLPIPALNPAVPVLCLKPPVAPYCL